jgi:hypothetical protein
VNIRNSKNSHTIHYEIKCSINFVCSIAPTLLHQTIQFVATTSTRSTRSFVVVVVVFVVAAAAAASTRFASRFSLEAHTEKERDPGSDTQKSPLAS